MTTDTPTGAMADLAAAATATKGLTITSWFLQLVTAAILLQTLFFKFTGAEESVYIFSKLGLEPWGRIGAGVAELVACILLLTPQTAALGALLSIGVISGALIGHLTRLGIVVRNDGGLLFGLAVAVFVCNAATLVLRRKQIRAILDATAPAIRRTAARPTQS